MRRAAGLFAAAAVSLLSPAGAGADISCSYTEAGAAGPAGNVLAISATTPELDVVAVQRSGDEIVVSNDAMGLQVPCAGATPSVTNVDTINFSGAVATSFVIDERNGAFAPGATLDPFAGSEIEWNLDWQQGFLVVNSVPGTDAIGLGLAGSAGRANLNRAFEDPWDAEVSLGDLQSVFLRGDNGDEFLSAAGSFAPFTEFTAPLDRGVSLDGGGGKDLLHGGAASDLIDGGGGKDDIVGGLGRDDIIAGGGSDKIDIRDGLRDHLNCGSGRDRVRKDSKDKLIGC